MPVKKYKLTAHEDNFKGTSGKDLFLAQHQTENITLNAADRLNGGKELDTIRADIRGTVGAPVMKSIEQGIFELVGPSATLDLANARQMHKITIKSADDPAAMKCTIDNAGAVRTIRVAGSDSNDEASVYGLDPKAGGTLSLVLADTQSRLGAFTSDGKRFDRVEVRLVDTVDATLWGSALSARDVTIRSMGGGFNSLTYDPGQYLGTVRHLTVEGNASFFLNHSGSEIFRHLRSLDLTGMKSFTQMLVGGEKLISVLGSATADFIRLSDLGGSEKHKAEVRLGAGNDGVTLLTGCYDAATQRIDGGGGGDTITFLGGVTDLWKGIRNFEAAYFYDAVGTYDLRGLDMSFTIGGTQGAVTLDRLKSGSVVSLLIDFTTFLTIKVQNAAQSQTESAVLELTSNMTAYGNSVVGLIAPDLSELRIVSSKYSHSLYLTTIGSATDGATLEIGGDAFLFLRATNGSTSYIDKVTITNTKGADLSGLESAGHALLGTGVTIIGGKGDDVLVGGIGADSISTGGGDNIVLGSLGADKITLGAGSGLDRIIYRADGESGYGLGYDTIGNFGIFDAIDVSTFADVTFMGNFSSNAAGIAMLSTSQQRAFFNTTTDTLYIDIDHDKALGLNHDMQIVLTGLSSFSSANLIG